MACSPRDVSLFDPDRRTGLLLSQTGAHIANKFAEYLEPLGLSPGMWGFHESSSRWMVLVSRRFGAKLRVFPSRLVAMLDELEHAGLVERQNRPSDRRSYALHLTPVGLETLKQIGKISKQH